MGYGNGVVDWGMQSAPLQQGVEIDMSEWRKALDKANDKAHGWYKKAIEVQGDVDDWIVQAWGWKETAMNLSEEYAPHLSPDDVLLKFKKIKPIQEKKYYHEYSSKRTWDK